jgi:hypothetical protein
MTNQQILNFLGSINNPTGNLLILHLQKTKMINICCVVYLCIAAASDSLKVFGNIASNGNKVKNQLTFNNSCIY